MATCAGKGGGAGGFGGVEGDTAALEVWVGRVIQSDDRAGLRRGPVGDVDNGDGISDGVEYPSTVAIQRNTARHSSNGRAAEDFATGGV